MWWHNYVLTPSTQQLISYKKGIREPKNMPMLLLVPNVISGHLDKKPVYLGSTSPPTTPHTSTTDP